MFGHIYTYKILLYYMLIKAGIPDLSKRIYTYIIIKLNIERIYCMMR